MCLKPKDLQTYQEIVAKMMQYMTLTEDDKNFLIHNGLKVKYDSYILTLNVKQQLKDLDAFIVSETERINNRSNVSS